MPKPRMLTAVLAIIFAAFTVAAWGSGTGPGTTGNAGPDALQVAPDTAAAVRALQEPAEAPAPAVEAPAARPEVPAAPPPAPPGEPMAVPEGPPISDHEPEAETPKARETANGPKPKKPKKPKKQGKGHGLGNTYCQELKGSGGPAFGRCISAKAHEVHGKKR